MSLRPLIAALVLSCLFAVSSSAYGHGPGMGGFSGGAIGMHGGFGVGYGAHGSHGWGSPAHGGPRSLHLSQRLAPTQPRGPIRPTGDPSVLAARDLTRFGVLPFLIGAPAWPYATSLSGPLWWALGYPGLAVYGVEAFDPKLPYNFARAVDRGQSPIYELPEPRRSIPPSKLRNMGLGGLQTISDGEGNAIHGW